MGSHLSRVRIVVAVALGVILLLAVAALAAPPPGKGPGKGDKHGKPAAGAPTAGATEYGAGGKQYGKHRVAICHKGHTIRVAQPAVKAHLRHGDKPGPC
jgi:hypothetical protein